MNKEDIQKYIETQLHRLHLCNSKIIVYGLLDPQTKHLKYIGRSSSGLERPKKHIWNMNEQKTRYSHLRIYRWINSLKEIGEKPFIIVLEECTDEKSVAEAEKKWIKNARLAGYDLTNLSDGGEGNCGHKSIWKGTKKDPEKVELHAQKMRGRKRSQEQLEQARKKRELLNKTEVSENTRKRLSETSKHKKPIKDNFGNIYESVNEAAKKLSIKPTSVTRSLKNEKAIVDGKYSFKYLRDEDKLKNITSPCQIIDQYGNIYESATAAAKQLNIQSTTIYITIYNPNRTAGGYKFRYVTDKEGNKITNKRESKAIKIIDQNGKIYESAKEASHILNISTTIIYNSIKFNKQTSSGFQFRFLDFISENSKEDTEENNEQ